MKLHLSGPVPTIHWPNRQQLQDLWYAALFIIGAPAVTIGSMYLVETAFDLIWK